MAAADAERSVDSASETAFNELDAVLPPKEEPTTALTAVVEKNSVFFFFVAQCCVTLFACSDWL